MVPKNSSAASSSKASTGDDLSLSAISLEIGWNSATVGTLDTLSDIMVRYLTQLAKQTKKYTEHYGRTLVNEDDVALGFKDMNVSIPELEEYLQNFEPIQSARQCPYFPVPRRTDLNFLRPGSQEVLTRPVHVHEYMPPMIIENEEKGRESDEENKSPRVVSVKQEHFEEGGIYNGDGLPLNGLVVLEEPMVPEVGSELIVEEPVAEIVEVKTEPSPQPVSKVVEEESSDDDIEPASAKAAAVFATFKSTKKLENPSENPALKRVRKVLQEEGHPIREVTSVMMTTSGFLSESREGKTAESRPPAFRDFFDTSPPPPAERKKRIPTMKKILEGVKKLEARHADEEPEEDGPGLFDVMDKIVTAPGGANAVNPHADDMEVDPIILGAAIGGENGEILAKLPTKKLSKQERKLLSGKERKELRALEKKKKKMKELLKSKSSNSLEKAKEFAGSSKDKKNKLTIFTKKLKSSGVSSSLTQKQLEKIRKKEQKKLKVKGLKELKIALTPVAATEPVLFQKPVAAASTEMIESDEDFSNVDSSASPTKELVVPPVHLVTGAAAQAAGIIPKKKLKLKKEAFKLKPAVFDQKSPKRAMMKNKQGLTISPTMLPPIPNLTKVKIGTKMGQKRGIGMLLPPHGLGAAEDGMPPMKKKRGRPKKNWTGEGGLPQPHHSHHPQSLHSGGGGPGGSVPLPAAQLASIGKSLMIKEPSLKLEPPLKLMKLRKEHMEPVQDFHHPQFTTKPPTISPKPTPIVSADLLKRLPAAPGLIPDAHPPPPMRLKELPPSISITPAAISPQKEAMQQAAASSSRNFGGGLPPNVCSSVTITRIDMSHQQKLPSAYDDQLTPGIGPPPMLTESPKSRSRMKGVPPPPPLQIPMQTETESGITITPIMMGNNSKDSGAGGGRYGDIPPPPPLQERPQKAEKASMLAKLDEELSSSKEQRKKEKEERKEMKKQKKKKAKDKDKPKDKSEKKKKKKDKSEGSAGEQTTSSSTSAASAPPVPKITLKLGGHSNTPTPVDSPNPPQVFIDHSDHLPTPPPLQQQTPKTKITFKPIIEEKVKAPVVPAPMREASPDFNVARFSPLVTRPQKPARAAKAHAAAAVAACSMGSSFQQEIVSFPAMSSSARDSQGGRGVKRGRPPKGAAGGGGAPPTPTPATAVASSSKGSKPSLTVLETETVGCIIDDKGNKIWICPACGRQDDGSPMIGCDMCDDWYHFPCVGIVEEPKEDSEWFCKRCLKVRSSSGAKGKQKKRK
ncbi:Transcription initiation factor TFIID subunit 3 [Orchesella cincta]|uniref:Transcription initiation factor TFIID subunit 3 n=1 Tax=Orchesella cincta TaxID=48709 RepID=A0A1D2MA97_ORCCI|nr:Transcription initiation factor TFIID subunit 3 [Orchesella cincta]